MPAEFKQDDYFWCPDDKDGFLLLKCGAKPFKPGDDGVECVRVDSSGANVKVTLTAAQTSQVEATDASSKDVIEDMVKLGDLKEASILHNLRERFKVDDIYTKIGTILVAVNPFKIVNLYSPDILEAYAMAGDRKGESGSVLPPHIFQLADQAYRNVVTLQESQSCLVSGESGAGKTEATKILLQFLTEMSARTASEDWGEQGRLQEQILKANPLMEAFGNAKTVRNNNSSRFGKYIEVKFNAHMGTIIGGSVTQYLLEKSRIVFQSKAERNYHIFYQMCAAGKMDEELRKKYRLADQDQFHYIYYPDASEGINDERGWEETVTAMNTLSMSSGERDDVLRTVSAVLHLGNMKFSEKKVTGVDQACQVENQNVLELVAYFLGVEPEPLSKALTQKEVKTPNASSVFQQYTIKQAEDLRDSLAKAVYGVLFDWLIKRINWALSAASKSAIKGQKMAHGGLKDEETIDAVANADDKFDGQPVASIGVLDIFGFESFETNSFEQLCINYCNEKLQGYFTEHIFKLEQAEYVAEGLSMTTITFKDNSEIIDMLERRRTGLFSMIDEEISVPRGSDEGLLSKIYKSFKDHPNFRKSLKDQNVKFGIQHFAGEVQYTVTGFLDKNKDAVPIDLVVVLQASQHRFIRSLFPVIDMGPGKKSGVMAGTAIGGKRSIIVQFKDQLTLLMATLSSTSPHFIRCVKPNKLLKGNIFDGVMVLEQLRYAGLLEVCKIRKQGFPVRRDHSYFLWRFGLLLGKGPEAAQGRSGGRALCEALEKKGMLKNTDWVCGKSKIFLKNEAFDKLERLRAGAVDSSAVTIQAMVRGKITRTELKKARELLKNIASATAAKDVQKIEELLLNTGLLPNQGRHLPQIKAARRVMQQVEEERRVEKLLVEAIAAEELDSLTTAVAAASQLGYNSPSVTKGQELISELKHHRKLKLLVDEAVLTRDLDKLKTALQAASQSKRFHEGDSSITRAKALVQRLQEEETVAANLKKCIAGGKVNEIKEAIDKMVEMGMSSHPLVTEGLKITKEASAAVEKFQKVMQEIRISAEEAILERDFDKLEKVQTSCLEMGITRGKDEVVDRALALLEELNKFRNFAGVLSGSRKALSVKAARVIGLESEADLNELKEAIESAKKGGVSEEDAEFAAAKAALERGYRQLEAQKVLLDLLNDSQAQKDYAKLRAGIERCVGLEMTTVDVFIRVRERILQIEADKKSQPADMSKNRLDEDIQDEDALEKRNEQRLKDAASPGYNFANYFRLRSDADFAKGIMFNKSKPIHLKLAYQSEPIHKSLIEFPLELSRQAVRLNRSILGYCGDVMMSFPASLAQDLVDKCLVNPELSDEVYLQLMKHVSGNPEPQSVGRAWQLICICVGAFPPSTDFEPYLLNFLLKFKPNKGIIGQYARYALRRLQSTISFGPTESTVSVEEILAYADRPPVMATVVLVDGTKITNDFPIPPHMNVDDVLRVCTEFLSLSDERAEFFGMFVKETESKKKAQNKENVDAYFVQPAAAQEAVRMPDGMEEDVPPPPPPMDDDDDDVPPRTVYPLESVQHLGDVVLAMARTSKVETFIFKRKFFLPNQENLGTDPVYNRLMYLQVLDEVVTGNWHVPTEALAIELTAIAFAVDLGEDMPTTAEGCMTEGLNEYIPQAWREVRPLKEWADLILKKRADLVTVAVDELELLFVKICSTDLPTYGATLFYCRKQHAGSDYTLFVDCRGLRLMTLKTRELVQNIPFKLIRKFNGTSRMLTIELITDPHPVVFYTSQAKEIAALMNDYTTLISLAGEQDAPKDKATKTKSVKEPVSPKGMKAPPNLKKIVTGGIDLDVPPPPPSPGKGGSFLPAVKPQMKPSAQNHTAQASADVLGSTTKKKLF